MGFTHLHVHTQYSLLDGMSSVKGLIARIKELGMDSVAITDHGAMFGVVEFYKECTASGVKPLLGCEVYVAERSMAQKDAKKDWNNYHLVLLAENNTGYANLMKIVSRGYTEGFYRKPRVDLELLESCSEGIIALTGCIAGRVPQLLLADRDREALEELRALKRIFGRDNLFVELQDHGLREEKAVMGRLVEMARAEGLGIVCTNDSHYTFQSDAAVHEVLLCVQTATNMDDPKRMKFEGDSFYVKSEEEMRSLFAALPEAADNTSEIARRCCVELNFHDYHLPKFKFAEEDHPSPKDYLRERALEGLARKYGRTTPQLSARMDYELSVIDSMGFNDYFLIVWDFIKYARDNGIPVGPGRGSAAGSLVSYCLDITQVDPIRYNLIFERFLNEQRISMPDIDIDFCYERRHLVIEYVVSKYGEENVAQIITFGTLGAKNAIRDVGRSLSMSYAEVDRVAKEVPSHLGTTIDSALAESASLRAMVESDPRVEKLIAISRILEGTPRHASTHAAGIVVTDRPVSDYVPLYLNDGNIATQFPMTLIEELGLLKMDFLGLRTLSVIHDAQENIRRSRGEDVSMDPNVMDFDDPGVYRLISRGDTLGVFQLEGSGMRAFMQNLRPDTFEDIIAGIAIYRPGPMQFIDAYIANKRDPSKIRYLCEGLDPILDVTYGCMIYQEQVMQVVRDLAGFSMGDSDNVRRAMSKKKEKDLIKERKRFVHGDPDTGVPGCVANGIGEAQANALYDQMMEFASYAFNKSHAAAYAVITYQTAFLKAYYPAEFMAALMTSVVGDDTKLSKYVQHLNEMDVKLLGPDVNGSFERFTVTGSSIRHALLAIKGLGEAAVMEIIDERERGGPYSDFYDFVARLPFDAVNKRAVEGMIKCGAFDSLGHTRRSLLTSYPDIVDAELKSRKRNISGQMSFFDMDGGDSGAAAPKALIAELSEYDLEEILTMEKESLGLYISGHPLTRFKERLAPYTPLVGFLELNPGEEEEPLEENLAVYAAGIVTSVKTVMTKTGSAMAFVTLEDLFGPFEAVVFPKLYEQKSHLLKKDTPVLVKGKVSRKDDTASVAVSSIHDLRDGGSLPPAGKRASSQPPAGAGASTRRPRASAPAAVQDRRIPPDAYVMIEMSRELASQEILLEIKNMLRKHSGDIRVVLHYQSENKKYLADRSLWVSDDYRVVQELRDVLGHSSINIVERESASTA